MKYIIFIITPILVLFSGGVVCLPAACADSYSYSSINNSVSVHSSSGGNVVSGKNGLSGSNGIDGVVVSGSAEADVYIKTVVNGEVVQYVNEHYESQEGEGVKVEKEFHYQSEDGETKVDTNINIEADSSSKTGKSIDAVQAQVLSYGLLDDTFDKEIKDDNSDNLNNKDIVQSEGEDISEPDTAKRSLIASIVNFFNYVFSIFVR